MQEKSEKPRSRHAKNGKEKGTGKGMTGNREKRNKKKTCVVKS